MPLLQSSQDHLPEIDAQVSPDSLAGARALVSASLPSTTSQHPSLPPLRELTDTSLISPSLDAPPTSTPLDTSRYTLPSSATDPSALSTLHLNIAHQTPRATNLSLLETFGRNAWLVSNAGLEDILRDLETEVKAARDELSAVQQARTEAQAACKGEMEALEGTWRESVGRSIEVQVACAKLRSEILERRREGAQ